MSCFVFAHALQCAFKFWGGVSQFCDQSAFVKAKIKRSAGQVLPFRKPAGFHPGNIAVKSLRKPLPELKLAHAFRSDGVKNTMATLVAQLVNQVYKIWCINGGEIGIFEQLDVLPHPQTV